MAGPSPPHPSPHRHRVRLVLVVAGLIAGPLAWLLVLNLSYGFSSFPCFPGANRIVTPQSPWPWMPGLVVALHVAAIGITAAAGFIAYRTWRATQTEAAGHPLDIGEGRTRFMGAWGMMVSALFIGLLVFNLINTAMVAPCAG